MISERKGSDFTNFYKLFIFSTKNHYHYIPYTCNLIYQTRMRQNKCVESNTSQYSPFGQMKFPLNIPSDPRKKCAGCGEPKVKNAPTNRKQGNRKVPKKYHAPATIPKVVSSSDSDLSFLQVGNGDNLKTPHHRAIRYQDQVGTSFGAHLLQKSKPLLAEALDEKLQFKRDSDAGNIVIQQRRKLTQPSFINEVDSEQLMQFHQNDLDSADLSKCPPPRPIKKNLLHNQFLTTSNRAKEGLKYVMAANFPRLPPDPPTGSPPIQHEIRDICGRKSHHPKLRARDLGKRLCEAPSMTKELDDLYKEYIQRCPVGNEHSEACRFLHHAPSPHHREPRRSILKDPRTSAASEAEPQQRKESLGKSHLVHFDKHLISTGITKVSGIDASLRETDARLKLLSQFGGRITDTGSQTTGKEAVPERYPLHIQDPKKTSTIPQSSPLDWLKRREQEVVEENTAKQDLARIYFTNEATRLIACANLAALDRNTSMFKKTDMTRRPSFPHFFMDRLVNDLEMEHERKKKDKIASVKSEMDAFDENVKGRPLPSPNPLSKFDPSQMPSEKSLNDLKLKVEIMKRQRERDVQAAAGRYRTRKSYFHQMLPCFADVIKNDLMEYSIKKACKLSGEEKMLARDLLMVASSQRSTLEERKREYDEEEEELSAAEEGERPVTGGNEKMIRGILEVCVDVAVKFSNYKTATGNEPPDSLRRQWKDAGFSLWGQQGESDTQMEAVTETVCEGEGTSEEDTGSQTSLRKLSELSNETADEMKDASMSGRSDGDDNHARCVVAINAVKESVGSEAISTVDGEPTATTTTTVQVQITDCLHEDLESALTYDGLFLPVTESQLTHSTSETLTESSASASATPSDSPEESFADCLIENPVEEGGKQNLEGYEYEEYVGEDGEYFQGNNGYNATGIAVRVEGGELGEETTTEFAEGANVGEVEVQAIDYSEGESPDGGKQKGRGLQFSEVVDKRPASAGEYAAKGTKSGGESKSSLKDKDSIKFHLPDNFVSKRNPVIRKKTAFRPKGSIDDADDDDDDDDKEQEVGDDYGQEQNSELAYPFSQEEGGMAEEEEDDLNEGEEEGAEDDAAAASSSAHDRVSRRSKTPSCSEGPSKRKSLVYEGLDNISYGMNSSEHEQRFLEQRFKELKQFSETWCKGLGKPPSVFTSGEKNFVPFSNQFTGKRMPPFNILDPTIPRPTFNLRMKSLIRKAEQAKLARDKCAEEKLDENYDLGQSVVTESVKRTCSDRFRGKPKKRPSWQEEIAEYECRRKEREKLMKAEEVDDSSKTLGFDAFHKTAGSLRPTFFQYGNSAHVHIVDDPSGNEEEQDDQDEQRKSLCVSGLDGTLPDEGCEDDEDENAEEEEECDEDGENCQFLNTKYLEIPGEGMMYEENLYFPQNEDHHAVNISEEEMFSIQDVYNE